MKKLIILSLLAIAQASPWIEPTQTSKPWTRWWWLGSAVDEAGLTAQLDAFAAAGMGGVEICPIYGVNGFENLEKKFLSPEWMKMLDFSVRHAQKNGLGFDMTTGTGWPFGAPWINTDFSSHHITWKKDSSAKGIAAAEITATIMRVKRPAPGGDGNVLDPFSDAALAAYLQPFDKAFATYKNIPIRSQFHDSFEYFNANWSLVVPKAFREMKGYDLLDHSDAFTGKADAETTARVMHDYREVMGLLHLGFVKKWNEWSQSHGWLTRNQAHGAPANLLDLYAAVSIPETEAFGALSEDDMPMLQFASSAAHVKGSTLVSAESFTWLGDHFQTSLADLKKAADYLWLTGVNHLFFHGIPYSPKDAAFPGWQFYASVNMGPQGGLWHGIPEFNRYISRVQSILQSGKPDGDVLIYFPCSDIWQSGGNNLMPFTMHNVHTTFASAPFYTAAHECRKRGSLFDFISDAQIQALSNTITPLYIAACNVMPEKTLTALINYAEHGGTVLWEKSLPQQVSGWKDWQARQAAMQKVIAGIKWKNENGTSVATLGKGKFIVAERSQLLENIKHEALADDGLRFVRRKDQDITWYFIVNQSPNNVEKFISLNQSGKTLFMNPLRSDEYGLAETKDHQIKIQLDAGESIIARVGSCDETAAWQYRSPQLETIAFPNAWHVEFMEGGKDLPAAYDSPKAQAWTLQTGDAYQTFAGTAAYSTTFSLNSVGKNYLLDLGNVGDSADVFLNDKKVASLWSRPFRVMLHTDFLQGENKLRIEVTNVAANRVRALDQAGVKWKIFKDTNIVSNKNNSYQPFNAASWQVRPAGLLDEVKLLEMK